MEKNLEWQLEVTQAFEGETADEYIQMIEGFLRDEPGNVLREFTSELILNLRTIRNFAQRAQQDSDAAAKAVMMFTTFKDGEEIPVTADEFLQTLLDRVAETRQLAECLKFYAMALQENSSVHSHFDDLH